MDSETNPIDSTMGCVELDERKTWHANRGSKGCLVMNPKYLQNTTLKERRDEDKARIILELLRMRSAK